MPIYEQVYRRYEAREPLRRLRFWPITREALRLVLAKRAFLGLLALSWLPFVVRLVQVYVVTRFPEAGRVLPVDGRLFGDFLNGQTGLSILLTVFGGAGLIANDLRTGAILVYLSRPLTRRDYVLGKLGVLMALLLSVTLVPALALYGLSVALAPEQFASWKLLWIAPAIVLHALVMALVLSLVTLAISALSRSARVAGLAYVGLIVGLEIVRGIVSASYDRPEAILLSLQANLYALGHALFGTTANQADVHWMFSALLLAAVSLVCLAILRARVRAVEIVS
jgi:ABC-2 type transport system permease protein